MNKAIKKEIERQLRSKNPPAEWQRIISRYLDEIAGSDKAIILRVRYFNGRGYWQTIKELNAQRYFMSQTIFYERVGEIIADLALRAAYERLICPYCIKGDKEK